MKISDSTAISMPARNLISIVVAVSVGVWAFFGIQERLNRLETAEEIMKKAIEHEVRRLQDGIDIIRIWYSRKTKPIRNSRRNNEKSHRT